MTPIPLTPKLTTQHSLQTLQQHQQQQQQLQVQQQQQQQQQVLSVSDVTEQRQWWQLEEVMNTGFSPGFFKEHIFTRQVLH